LADTADHHPEIEIRFKEVRLTLHTHDVGGVTEKDITLAEQIDFATSAR
jgi:4a-hydroxytetrahydrobiopterin dehydratase